MHYVRFGGRYSYVIFRALYATLLFQTLTSCQMIRSRMEDSLTEVCYETSAAEALVNFMKNDYCLVILNTQIADMDCMNMLRTMRQAKATPILALTNSWKIEKIISRYTFGADACIDKSAGIEVCIAQANALIRLYINMDINQKQHGLIICGNELIISPLYRQVVTNGKFLE